jgi:hypothetical protein
VVKSWHCTEFADREKFAGIYWLLSREAVAQDSIDRFADEFLPEQQAAARQYNLFPGETRGFDDDFLIKLDGWREQLAVVFKGADAGLSSAHLTEAVQRTLDRLIFMRFLEDKTIEEHPIISRFGQAGKTHWQGFVEEHPSVGREIKVRGRGATLREGGTSGSQARRCTGARPLSWALSLTSAGAMKAWWSRPLSLAFVL